MNHHIERDKSQQAKHWDEEASTYDAWYEKERGHAFVESEARGILAALTLTPQCDVLELGCGTGRFTERMAPHVRSIVAGDLSEKSVAVVREKARTLPARIEARTLDATQALPFPDAHFDRVLSVQMLQHVDASQHASVVREIRRVLRPGGIAVLTVYRFGRWIRGENVQYASGLYRYAFRPHELAALFEKAGFSRVRVRGLINLPSRAFSLGKRLPILSSALIAMDRGLSALPWSARWGVYLLAQSTVES